MCSLLTLRAAELPANHAAAKAISSSQLHTGPGSRWAADRAALAATVDAAQHKHLKEQTLCWGQRGYCPSRMKTHCFSQSCVTPWCWWENLWIDMMISSLLHQLLHMFE